MKFTNLAVSTLLPFLALSSPVPEADALAFDNTPNTTLEKRSIAGTVDADELKYRRCPRQTKACDAIGEYPRGKTIYIDCYTATDTTTVNGDPRWGKLTNGYWVSLYYVNWAGGIPHC